MKCPTCGSNSFEALKSKKETSKTQEIEKLILKCNECQTVFRETISYDKPVNFRIIISELDSSRKDFIKIYPDDILIVGDILRLNDEALEVTSLENKNGKRVDKSPASELVTIWAASLDTPARVGISIDYHGRIISYKVDVDRDLLFAIGDVIRVDNIFFKITSIKTEEKKMRKGAVISTLIRRIYGKPLPHKVPYKFNLTSKVVKTSMDEKTRTKLLNRMAFTNSKK